MRNLCLMVLLSAPALGAYSLGGAAVESFSSLSSGRVIYPERTMPQISSHIVPSKTDQSLLLDSSTALTGFETGASFLQQDQKDPYICRISTQGESCAARPGSKHKNMHCPEDLCCSYVLALDLKVGHFCTDNKLACTFRDISYSYGTCSCSNPDLKCPAGTSCLDVKGAEPGVKCIPNSISKSENIEYFLTNKPVVAQRYIPIFKEYAKGLTVPTVAPATLPAPGKKPGAACAKSTDCGFGMQCANKVCGCPERFKWNEFVCEPLSTCAANSCDANARCIDDLGKVPTCICNPGFEGNGSSCKAINECADVVPVCGSNMMCMPHTTGFKCICPIGKVSTGRECIDVIPSIVTGLSTASPNSLIFKDEKSGEHKPQCAPFFAGDGKDCVPINTCNPANNPCSPDATCTDGNGKAPTCICKRGFSGYGDVCTAMPACKNTKCGDHATCSILGDKEICTCNDGFDGDGQKCTLIERCGTSNICHEAAKCTTDILGSGPICTCVDGFNGDGNTCKAPHVYELVDNGTVKVLLRGEKMSGKFSIVLGTSYKLEFDSVSGTHSATVHGIKNNVTGLAADTDKVNNSEILVLIHRDGDILHTLVYVMRDGVWQTGTVEHVKPKLITFEGVKIVALPEELRGLADIHSYVTNNMKATA